jgi:hypothetical protein
VGVAGDLFSTTADMLHSVGQTFGGFLEVLMEPVYVAPEPEPTRRKKKKKKGQSQGMSM